MLWGPNLRAAEAESIPGHCWFCDRLPLPSRQQKRKKVRTCGSKECKKAYLLAYWLDYSTARYYAKRAQQSHSQEVRPLSRGVEGAGSPARL